MKGIGKCCEKKSRVKQLDVHLEQESVHFLNPFCISYISFLYVT